MGPRSENRGYALSDCLRLAATCVQWVHGPRTVVMVQSDHRPASAKAGFNGSTVREPWLCMVYHGPSWDQYMELQWVHGPRTVVMLTSVRWIALPIAASMGPRSENRGYDFSLEQANALRVECFNGSTVREPWLCGGKVTRVSRLENGLQWVHGPRTVVMGESRQSQRAPTRLQWVHGPRTVVMKRIRATHDRTDEASMGPRSENRGYARMTPIEWRAAGLQWVHGPRTVVMAEQNRSSALAISSFNGSTVREPWLCPSSAVSSMWDVSASMGPRSENRGYVQRSVFHG